ncbi:MAG: hypothetical protein ABI361_12680 [Nitrososphaera sp.]|jgi:hypothetical protein
MSGLSVKGRSSELVRWLALSAGGAGVAAISGLVFHLEPNRIITAAFLSAGMVFSGYFMRSFGRDSRDRKNSPATG